MNPWDFIETNFTPPTNLVEKTFRLDWSRVTVGICLAIFFAYRILLLYDVPILSIREILWNGLVYVMPSKLVFALDRSGNPISHNQDSAQAKGSSTEHAAKSEVLRNVLRLDKGSRLRRHSTPDAPPGLGNWDNSCYQNSVIQALASLKSLEIFLADENLDDHEVSKESTASTLYKTVRQLNDQSHFGSYLWTPPKLKSMSSWQQQDAQEYFSKVIEEMEKDIRAGSKQKSAVKDRYRHLFALASLDHALDSSRHSNEIDPQPSGLPAGSIDAGREKTPARSTGIRLNPLEGLLAQRVGCTRCGYVEGLSLIPFNCVTLPLGRSWQYNIQECLDDYTNLESIEGVECAKCTLLQTKHQLRQLSETLATADEDEDDVQEEATNAKEDYRNAINSRLEVVSEALQDEDFAEATLSKKCQIPRHLRSTSTKSRQAIVMRAPRSLVLHVNRSLFDENTGAQLKNYSDVRYPKILDLTPWCVGSKFKVGLGDVNSITEEWEMNPSKSMIQGNELFDRPSMSQYELRAVVTHYGRHENGHYVCYRKVGRTQSLNDEALLDEQLSNGPNGQSPGEEGGWWRFSDEDVSQIGEDEVLLQGGVFMLFYERVNRNSQSVVSGKTVEAAPSKEVDNLAHSHSAFVESSEITTEGPPSENALEDSQEMEPVKMLKGQDENDKVVQQQFEALAIDPGDVNSSMTIPEELSQELAVGNEEVTGDPNASERKWHVGVPLMRTAGPEKHRRSEDRSPFRPLHMVASM